jgi:hypothetical protein
MRKLATILAAAGLVLTFSAQQSKLHAQYNASEGFKVAWTLDPRDFTDIFDRGPAFGARSVLVGMDFDRDGKKEILFSADETLAPGGPDPGFMEVFLYENAGDDQYNYVWHYTHSDPSNSLPPIAYGDIDGDGNWEIYLGVPTINDDPVDLFIFEADESGVFPSEPTLTAIITDDGAADFRPSGFALGDIDGDGKVELAIQSRNSGNHELVVIALEGDELDEFASFTEEFRAGEDVLGGGGTYDIEVFDFDGDGKQEIWYNTWDRFTFTIFEADSADSYSLQVELDGLFPTGDPGSFNSHDLYFEDVDGDGTTEGVFPMTDGKIYILGSTSDVSTLTADDFSLIGTADSRGVSRGGSVGDIDDDGRLDVIIANGTSENIARLEYQGYGSPSDSSNWNWSIIFESVGDPTDRYYPPRIAPSDLDGDGFKEVVLTNLFASEAGQPIIIVLEYDPTSDQTTREGWTDVTGLKITDMDSTYQKDFSGNARTVIGGMDMDQDGKKEILVNDYVGHRVIAFEFNSDANVFEQVWASPVDTNNTAPANRQNPRTVSVGDLDNDNKWEIIFPLGSEPRGWYVYEWDGVVGSDNYGSVFSAVANVEIDTCCTGSPTSWNGRAERSTVADVDGDGQHELVSMIREGSNRGTLIIHAEGDIEHNAGGQGLETWVTEFFVSQAAYGGGSPYHSQPADLDGDGSLELVNHTWNNFNFYNIDVTGTDTYTVAPDTALDRNYKATSGDHVALFGGGAGDVDGDGDEEAFFPNYYTGDLFVVDYKSGDDVLKINENHVVNLGKVGSGFGTFHASVFDVDQNGRANVFVGSTFPRSILSLELTGDDPRNPSDYETSVIFTGDPSIRRNIVVIDSAGIKSTKFSNTGAFATKVQSNWHGNPIDLDDDGEYEVLASFQANTKTIITTNITWNGAAWDTTTSSIDNDRMYIVKRFEFTPSTTSVKEHEVTFITPDNYILEQNYPNPFNPTTNIRFELPLEKKVNVRIYNIMGQLVKTLIDGEKLAAGLHEVEWDATNTNNIRVASGVYIYSLEFGNFRKTKRMTLLK